ncbi:MAG: type 4a pilus biogenesis protein PilO [Nitrospirae bacterium]|nr:type 4a pilus biogenesis protein PilO [Nitrospirota bacterium]
MNLFNRFEMYKREAVVAIILIGIIFFSFFFFLQASKQSLENKEVQWKETRKQMDAVLRRKKVERDLDQFVNLLEDQQNYADVINRPMVIAKKYHLTVPSVIYQKEKVEQEFLRVSFAFSVIGKYESIREFIADIESAKSLYVIEDMKLGKSSKEGSLLELQLKMITLLKTNKI